MRPKSSRGKSTKKSLKIKMKRKREIFFEVGFRTFSLHSIYWLIIIVVHGIYTTLFIYVSSSLTVSFLLPLPFS